MTTPPTRGQINNLRRSIEVRDANADELEAVLDLLREAVRQGQELSQTLRIAVHGAGWTTDERIAYDWFAAAAEALREEGETK